MSTITLKSYAKINLSLDVLGLLENGYHEVEMVMQQITLADDIAISVQAQESGRAPEIIISTNRRYLPTDSRNLAYGAAALMAQRFGKQDSIRIDIKKRIPVAAGLAGGSGNAAAVLHGLNALWGLGLDVAQLCELGRALGSDVPFCIMGQARCCKALGYEIHSDPLASACALATGTGTELVPLPPLKAWIVLMKPPLSVSTAEVYRKYDCYAGLTKENAVDPAAIPTIHHPDTKRLIRGLQSRNYTNITESMANVLETVTLNEYNTVMYTKNKAEQDENAEKVLMSGSGPTIFIVYTKKQNAEAGFRKLKKIHKEVFLARTML